MSWKIRKLRLALKIPEKNPIYSGNLHQLHLQMTNVKSISSLVDNFNRQFLGKEADISLLAGSLSP